jgi:hypothetical protein
MSQIFGDNTVSVIDTATIVEESPFREKLIGQSGKQLFEPLAPAGMYQNDFPAFKIQIPCSEPTKLKPTAISAGWWAQPINKIGEIGKNSLRFPCQQGIYSRDRFAQACGPGVRLGTAKKGKGK